MPKLTETFVASLEPDGRDRTIFDSLQPGFAIRVTPAGSKIFIARANVAGRKPKARVGYHPELTVVQAREQARQVLADLRHGRDPALERKARLQATAAGEMTITELADKWLADYVRPKLKPRTVFDYERLVAQHIKPGLGHLPVARIERDDIVHCTSLWPGYRGGRITPSPLSGRSSISGLTLDCGRQAAIQLTASSSIASGCASGF